MKRIRAFGCSLTQQHHWKYLMNSLTDLDLKSYAIGSQGNDIQFAQYMNAVHDGDILKDDIIIWQLTSTARRMANKSNKKLDIRPGTNQVEGHGNGGWLDMENIFCPGTRISGVVSPIRRNSGTLDTNPKDTSLKQYMEWMEINNTGLSVYDTLLQLNGVKRDNDKLLVVFGWQDIFSTLHMDKPGKILMLEAIKYLEKQGIDYIEESIIDYSKRLYPHKKGLTQWHPPQEGYKSFTENCLLPKLKKLKWIGYEKN